MNIDRYQGFVFDWDGTIARSLEVWLKLLRDVLAERGFDNLADNEIALAFGHMKPVCIGFGLKEADFPAFEAEVVARAKVIMPTAPFYDGVEAVLEQLKNHGKRISLVTSNSRVVIDQILEMHGVADEFDIVVSGNDTKALKPDPEGVLLAVEKMGVNPDQAIMLGDSAHDIGAAKNAGIDSLLYYPATHELFYDFEKLKSLKPTYIISDWASLFAE